MSKVIILVLSALLLGCISKYAPIPEDVLPEDKMRQICIDFHTEESFIMQANLQGDSTQAAFKEARKKVLAKYKVDSSYYARSKEFYDKHPNNFLRVYEGVVDSLALHEQRGLLQKQ